jgi:hypothetical protein
MNHFPHLNGHSRRRSLPLIILSALCAVAWLAQAKAAKSDMRDLKREMLGDTSGAKPSKRDDNAKGGKPNADDAQARSLARLREHLEVTDDAEWSVIAERINRLSEARASLGTAAPGPRGSPAFSEKGKRSKGSGNSAHPEQDALRSALRDNLPDAEIRTRLARAHDVFQQNEARLAKAQADLRAVLTVRQEAVAVMYGLLPP